MKTYRTSPPLPPTISSMFPVTHSVLSTAALLTEVAPAYDIGAGLACTFLFRWLNDTYLVQTTNDQYILRVYRAGWRTFDDICYELEVLNHLGRQGVPISLPIARRDGNLLTSVQAPEGERFIVLFTYARGKETSQEGDQPYLYGRAVAAIHVATEDFASAHPRFHLGLAHILVQPLAMTLPLLDDSPDDQAYLQRLATRVHERINKVPIESLDPGFCHGDFHGGNAHLDDNQMLTFFDFDCCGAGWRVYDLAVFRWGLHYILSKEKQTAAWELFLQGYQERRPLQRCDLALIPWFVAARGCWFMGLVAGKTRDVGTLRGTYLIHQELAFLREWEAQHLDEK